MRKIACLLIAVIFFSGCALTTIKDPRGRSRTVEPPAKSVIEKVREVFAPAPVITQEKEEVLPVVQEEKEEILFSEPEEEEDIK